MMKSRHILIVGLALSMMALPALASVQIVVEYDGTEEGPRFSFVTVGEDQVESELDRLSNLPGVAEVTFGGAVSNPTKIESNDRLTTSVSNMMMAQAAQAYSDPYFAEQWYWHTNDSSRTFTDYVGTSRILRAKSVSVPLRKPRIAIIDGSFHPTADINFVEGVNMSSLSNKPKGPDFYEEPPDDLSHCGSHGNSVASIAAAYSDNAYGIAGIADADVVAVASLYCGIGGMPDVADGILWAAGGIPLETDAKNVPPISRPVDIINLSLGAVVDSGCQPWVQDAIDYARSKGIVVVAAVGNDRMSSENIVPASCEGVIAVGSIDQYRRPSKFTNYGSSVDIMAPGEQFPGLIKNDEVEYVSGTSFSAPIVTGLIAMALANNYEIDRDIIPTLLASTATTMEDSEDFLLTMPGTNNPISGHCLEDCGAGSLNAELFMQKLSDFDLARGPYIRHAFYDADESRKSASMMRYFDFDNSFCNRYEVIFNDEKDVLNPWTNDMSGRVIRKEEGVENIVIESSQPRLTATLDIDSEYFYQKCMSGDCKPSERFEIDVAAPGFCTQGES